MEPDQCLAGAHSLLALVLLLVHGPLEGLDLAGILDVHDGDEGLFHQPPVQPRPAHAAPGSQAGQPFVEIEDREYENGIGLETAKMNLELAEQEYEKQKSVYDKGGVTLRELRNAELQMTQARNDLEAHRSGWKK